MQKNFEKQLASQTQEAEENMQIALQERMDLYLREGLDRGKLLEENLKQMYASKARELETIFKDIRLSQSSKIDRLQENYLANKHAVVLSSMRQRFTLALDIAGPGKLSTVQEMQTFLDQGFKMLNAMDVYSMLQSQIAGDPSEGADLIQSYIDETVGSIPPDYLALVQQLQDSPEKSLDKRQLDIVATELKKINGGNVKTLRDNMGAIILSQLPHKQRLEVLTYMMDYPGMPELLQALTATNYITRSDAEALIKQGAAELEKELEKAGRKERRKGRARLERFNTSLENVQSDKMAETQKFFAAETKKGQAMLKRDFGHVNHAKRMLTGKGIISGLLFANGAFTMAGNLLANINKPFEMVTNPYMLLGVAMAGGGLQLSDGLGGLTTTPMELTAKATVDKDEIEDEKRDDRVIAMKERLGNNRLGAEFYYNFADEISAAYRLKKKKAGTPNVTLKFEDLKTTDEDGNIQDVKYEDLPERYKRVAKSDLEKAMSEFVRTFFQDKHGVSRKTGDSQRRFFKESIDEGYLAGVELWRTPPEPEAAEGEASAEPEAPPEN
jgi:hypothetical protein